MTLVQLWFLTTWRSGLCFQCWTCCNFSSKVGLFMKDIQFNYLALMWLTSVLLLTQGIVLKLPICNLWCVVNIMPLANKQWVLWLLNWSATACKHIFHLLLFKCQLCAEIVFLQPVCIKTALCRNWFFTTCLHQNLMNVHVTSSKGNKSNIYLLWHL